MPTTHLFQKAGTGSTQMRRLTAKQHQAMPEVFFRSLLRSYSPRPYWPVGNRCSHAANWTYDACVGAAGLRCAARGHRYAGEAEGKIPEGNKPAEVVLFSAISEFPKGRKYLISLSFRGKASVRPAQVGGFDVNIVIHGSTAVRGRGDLVAYRWALWKLTAPWTHRTRPPHRGKRCAFSTSSTGPFPSNHSRKTPKGPKIALGNPDRPLFFAHRNVLISSFG